MRCAGQDMEVCNALGTAWVVTPCEYACVEGEGCVNCIEGQLLCDPEDARRVMECQGGELVFDHLCAEDEGCRLGQCLSLCDPALLERSNEGCELWAVDLDNWYGTEALNPYASGEQYAVVATNVNDFAVTVVTEINDATPGAPVHLVVVDERTVAPLELVQIDLPQREVDGSVLN